MNHRDLGHLFGVPFLISNHTMTFTQALNFLQVRKEPPNTITNHNYGSPLNNLEHNVQALRNFTITLRDKGKIEVKIDGEARLYRVSRFLTKYAVLFCGFASFDWLRSEYETWEGYDKRMRATYSEQQYKGLARECAEYIKWLSENWYYAVQNRAYSYECLEGTAIYAPYDDIHSCMSNSEALELYVENPEKVKLFHIMDEEGYTIGRALLWKTDDDHMVLDRVYPSDNGPHTVYARKIAKENGWLFREYDSVDEKDLTEDLTLTVTLKDVKAYPYMDTFSYGKVEGKNLVISNCSFPGSLVLDFTENEDPWGAECDGCGCSGRNLVITAHGYEICESCIEEDFTPINGEYYHNDYVVMDVVSGDPLHVDDADHIDAGPSEGEYTHPGNTALSDEYGILLLSESTRIWNGDYAPTDECVQLTGGPYSNEWEDVNFATYHTDESSGEELIVHRDFIAEEELVTT